MAPRQCRRIAGAKGRARGSGCDRSALLARRRHVRRRFTRRGGRRAGLPAGGLSAVGVVYPPEAGGFESRSVKSQDMTPFARSELGLMDLRLPNFPRLPSSRHLHISPRPLRPPVKSAAGVDHDSQSAEPVSNFSGGNSGSAYFRFLALTEISFVLISTHENKQAGCSGGTLDQDTGGL
jgi:hypothetical protein